MALNDIEKRTKNKSTAEGENVVSASIMRRMPRYFRYLRDLLNNDILRISSGDLAKLMGITPSQVRQDFNAFGDFGQQGYGYNVRFLYTQVSRILCVNKKYPAVIIGAGDMTRALLSSNIFDIRGICIKGVFSYDKEDIGNDCKGFTVDAVEKLKDFAPENKIAIAVIALPEINEAVCDFLFECGIKGAWNFSLQELHSAKIKCRNVMLGDSLMLLMNEINCVENTENGGEKNGN